MRMEAETLAREHANVLAEQILGAIEPMAQVPELRINRQQRILTLQIGPAADLGAFTLDGGLELLESLRRMLGQPRASRSRR